jgi:AraC-like DNA-binding protein
VYVSCGPPAAARLEEVPQGASFLHGDRPVASAGVLIFGAAFQMREIIDPEVAIGHRDIGAVGEGVTATVHEFRPVAQRSSMEIGSGLIKFHFQLSGRNEVRFDNKLDFSLNGAVAVLGSHPEGMVKEESYVVGKPELSLTLACRAESLRDLVQADGNVGVPDLQRCLDGHALGFFGHTVALTPAMIQTLDGLLKPSHGSCLRHVHVQARSMDLMCLLIDAIAIRHTDSVRASTLRRRDLQALERARELLELRTSEPPTIARLAREVGINRTKLAAGFKQMFGETVFNYSQQVRLRVAHSLLGETDMAVSAIASAVGYESHSSFSVAFKSRFGITPSRVRRP